MFGLDGFRRFVDCALNDYLPLRYSATAAISNGVILATMECITALSLAFAKALELALNIARVLACKTGQVCRA